MAALAVAPLPAPVGSVVTVTGSGFANAKTRLLLDGAGATTNIFRPAKDGTFHVGITVATTVKSQTLVAEQYTGGKWNVVARLSPLLTFTPPVGPVVQDPILTGVGASNITSTTALISWTTSIPSDTRVEYDFDGAPYTISGYYDAVFALATDPIWYCRLGEPSGTTATDAAASPINGTYVGSPTLGVAGALGSDTNTAVTLNGSSQYVTVPDGAKLDVGDTFSIAGWFKRAGSGGYRYIVSKGTSNFAVVIYPNNRLTFRIAALGDLCDSGATTITDNGWHHFAATKSGSTSKLYLDGVDVTNTIANYTAVNNATAMGIGYNNNDAPGSYWNGSLDEIGVFNYALSAANVTTLYAARNGGGGTTYNPALVTTHAITLTGLTPSTGYHYRVVSVGPTGTLTSGDYTFTSAAAADTTAPVISSVSATSTGTNVTVTWTTDELASGVVLYGATPAYGSQSTPDTSFTKTSHSHTFGSTAGATIHYAARSGDAAGNIRTSGDFLYSVPSSGLNSITVDSIALLKSHLADNSLDEIVLEDGTYDVDPSTAFTTNSLWIGGSEGGGLNYATRTRPIIVRAETNGGVILDGGGGAGGIAFEGGVHDMTWRGFTFRDIVVSSGVIEIGGYSARPSCYNITLQHLTIEDTCVQATPFDTQNHAFYFSWGTGQGPHDILLEDITIEQVVGSSTALWGGIHAFHGTATNGPSNHVTVRRLTTTGLTHGVVLWWDTPCTGWLVEDSTITDAGTYGIRTEEIAQAAGAITFRNVTTVSSGSGGFFSSLGATPGVVFDNCTLG